MTATALSKGITGEYDQGENYTVSGNTNWRLLNAYVLDQWAHNPVTTTALTYGYRGGVTDTSTIIVAGTIALSDGATNYVERTGTGTVSKNTAGFTAGLIAMAKVVTAAGAITSIQDCRRMGTAPLADPVFTGIPKAPTATLGDTSPQIATTGFVQANAVSLTLVDSKGDLLPGLGDNTVGRLAVGANGFGLVADSTQTTGIKWQARDFSIPIMVGDGVSAVGTGLKAMVEVPVACTITAVRIVSMNGTSGSIVFDIWKDTYANAPPTVADTITGSNKPTVTTAVKSEQLTFATWTTTTLAIGDLLAVNVDSASGFTFVLLSITCRRT